MVLEKLKKPEDIKKLNEDQLKILAQEIREFLIEKIIHCATRASITLSSAA